MKLNRDSFLSVNLALGVAFVLLAVAWVPAAGPAQPVLRVPQDFPTIQAAIDAAPEGATILIQSKDILYYEENITIKKSVTLQGAPIGGIPIPAAIKGEEISKPVILIASDAPIQVALEYLDIVQGAADVCVWIEGQPRVSFNKFSISYYSSSSGLWIGGSAHVILQNSIISGFSGFGLRVGDVEGNAVVELINSQVSGANEKNFGLVIAGSSKVSLQHSTISGHVGGIIIYDPARVTLKDSVITGNREGIGVTGMWGSREAARVTLENSQISGNRRSGLYLDGGQIELRESFIEGNGTDPECQQRTFGNLLYCSGIIVAWQAQLKLSSTVIRHNADWGLAVYLSQCGFSYSFFQGKVTIEENKNIIDGNNRSGKLNGQGNPGNHPFKNLPDGQVCLP